MKVGKIKISKYSLIFLIIPLIFQFGGIRNVFKIYGFEKQYTNKNTHFEGLEYDSSKSLYKIVSDKPTFIFSNINSQVKTILLEINGIPTWSIDASVYYKNGGEFSDENSYPVKLRNGKNYLVIPTYNILTDLKIELKSSDSNVLISNDIKINGMVINYMAAFAVFISIILANKGLNMIKFKKIFLCLSLLLNYIIVGLELFYPTLRIQILGILLLIIFQIFFCYLIKEVDKYDEAIEIE